MHASSRDPCMSHPTQPASRTKLRAPPHSFYDQDGAPLKPRSVFLVKVLNGNLSNLSNAVLLKFDGNKNEVQAVQGDMLLSC